jgi:tetratricopeptide (TPR) repeat protein
MNNLRKVFLPALVFISSGWACGPDPCEDVEVYPKSKTVYDLLSRDYPDTSAGLDFLMAHYMGPAAYGKGDAENPERSSAAVSLKPAIEKFGEHHAGFKASLDQRIFTNQSSCDEAFDREAAVDLLESLEKDPRLDERRILRVAFWRLSLVYHPCFREMADPGPIETELKADPVAAPYVASQDIVRALKEKDFSRSRAALVEMEKTSSPWLKELSAYLRARILLVESQKNWDGYRWKKASEWGVDLTMLKKAEDEFTNYERAFPRGRYFSSAKNLHRRIHLLAGEFDELLALQAAAFNEALSKKDFPRLKELGSQELRSFSPPPATTKGFEALLSSPLLAASHVLGEIKDPDSVLDLLKKNQIKFQPYPGLYELARMRVLYATSRWKQIIEEFTAAQKKDSSPITGARLAILSRAYEKNDQLPEAIETLRELLTRIPGPSHPFEVRLAALYLRGHTAELLRSNSRVRDLRLRKEIFEKTVPTEDLVKIVQEFPESQKETVIGDALLRHLLMAKRFQDFLVWLPKVSHSSDFSKAETAARSLASQSEDAKGLINLGYFLERVHLGGGPDSVCCFCGQLNFDFHREEKFDGPLQYYMRAISTFSAGAKSDDEAKALSMAIQCFRERYGNTCGDWSSLHEIPLPTRKAWFATLHKKYPQSKWAKDTPYVY